MMHMTDERKGRTAAMGGLDANLALETGNVERNLAKIFREKVKVFGSVQFTQVNSITFLTRIPTRTILMRCFNYFHIISINLEFTGTYPRCNNWYWPEVLG